MLHFTIRDLMWLTVLAGAVLAWFIAAHRSTSLQARLHVAERTVEQLRAENEAIAKNNATDLATIEALMTAYKQAELSDDQRDTIFGLFREELERRNIAIVEVE